MIVLIIYLIGLLLSSLASAVYYHYDERNTEIFAPILGMVCLLWPVYLVTVIVWYSFIVPINFIGKQIALQLKKQRK